MKNSKEYSAKMKKLYLALKKEHAKPHKVSYDEPLDAIVYAIVSQNITESAANSAMKRLRDYFIDLNDLRVSRIEEIVEQLDGEVAAAKSTAVALVALLRAIFEKFNMVTLEVVKKMAKKPARQMIGKFVVDNRFVVDYCMLTALKGHAIPLTNQMIITLKAGGLADPEASHEEIEGFLARQVSAENAYEFYTLLRRWCERGKIEQVKEAKPKAKAGKK